MTDGSSKDSVANEVHARENNEWIEQMGDHFGWVEPVASSSASAAHGPANRRSTLTRKEYERIRSMGKQFVIHLLYENPGFDVVTEETANWAVVQKLPGEPTRIAENTDPRRTTIVPGPDLPKAS